MLCRILNEALHTAIKGVITLPMLAENWPDLTRHICDTPRKRKRKGLRDLNTLFAACESLS